MIMNSTLTDERKAGKKELREWARLNDRPLFLRLQKRGVHPAFYHLIDPAHEDHGKRFNFFKGGRGGMRTTSIARCFVDMMADAPVRLCAARSFQNSIASSNKQALEDQIIKLGLEHRFTVTRDYIESDTGAVCTFKGLERNPDSFKSFESLDALWWEEANAATRSTLDKVTPTLRKSGSILLFSYNPEDADAPIEVLQKTYENHSLGCVSRLTHYLHNPWCTEELKADAEALKASDYERYLHVFEGEFWAQSEASILGRKLKSYAFDIDESYGTPMIGVDWGFSQDPTAVVECYVRGNSLFIRRSANKVRLELVDTADWLLNKSPSIAQYRSFADSARPETISMVKAKVPLIRPVDKWAGSVEDGVSVLQSFDEIVVHPDCQHDTASELRAYCYKTDKNDNITRVIEDANNHYADAVRYALSPLIQARRRVKTKQTPLFF